MVDVIKNVLSLSRRSLMSWSWAAFTKSYIASACWSESSRCWRADTRESSTSCSVSSSSVFSWFSLENDYMKDWAAGSFLYFLNCLWIYWMYKQPSSVCKRFCFTRHLRVRYSRYLRQHLIFPLLCIIFNNLSLMNGGTASSSSSRSFDFDSIFDDFLKQSTHRDWSSFRTHSDFSSQYFSAAAINFSLSKKLLSLIFCMYSICRKNHWFRWFRMTSRFASKFEVYARMEESAPASPSSYVCFNL